MKTHPIKPAQVTRDEQGIPFSPDVVDRYHAQIGPQQQAQQVFIQGHDLPKRWQQHDRFVVLETGFGLGYNFLATWAAWRADAQRSQTLEFLSVEAHPLALADLQNLHQNSPWPELSQALIKAWPPLTPNWHVLHFEGGRVRLLLALGDVAACLPQIRACVDAFDLDGFSPQLNPEMWQAKLFKQMARLAAPGASVATWSSAGMVRQGLRSAGFEVHKAPGVGGKRHITLGTYAPKFVPRKPPIAAQQRPSSLLTATNNNTERRTIIVGAGLAGCSAAWALAQQGWRSEVWDRHSACASDASGNWAGLFHGVVHAQGGMHARALRAAALQAQIVLKQALQDGVSGEQRGLLRLITPADEPGCSQDDLINTWRAHLSAQGLPPSYAQVLDAKEASSVAAHPIEHPAWFFPGGGWIDPGALACWFLKTAGERSQFCGDKAVARLEKTKRGWALLDAKHQLLGEAPCVVLASAADATRLWATLDSHADEPKWAATAWPIERVRGQLSRLVHPDLACELKVPVAGAGYVIPWQGHEAGRTPQPSSQVNEQPSALIFGATSQINDLDPDVRLSDHASNWVGLMELLGKNPESHLFEQVSHKLQGRTQWRAVSRDRLPLIGGVPQLSKPGQKLDQTRFAPREPGLFVYTALGSRGITWAALGAHMLAAWVCGSPAPVEADVWEALDPARFLVRAARKAGSF